MAGLRLVTLDQGPMGHQRRKPTTILANLDGVGDLHGVNGPGEEEGVVPGDLNARLRTSKTWAAWAPGFVEALKRSLEWKCQALDEEEGEAKKSVSKLDLNGWKRHIGQGHAPFRSDCRICAEAMGCDAPHRGLEVQPLTSSCRSTFVAPSRQGKTMGRA